MSPSEPGAEPRAESDDRTRRLLRRRERVLAAGYRLFYRRPVELVAGSGARVTDAAGREYLDAYNNVPVIGHSHPLVAERVAVALGRINTHTRYLDEALLDYSERLLARFGPGLDRISYACSGSEAVDLAMRIARHVTGARGMLCTSNAYHGVTSAAASVSPSLGDPGAQDRAVVAVGAPDELRDDPREAPEAFAERVRAGIAELRARGCGFAGMICDSVLSSDGVQGGPAGLLGPARQAVREAGGLWIADEVQAGFLRTGEAWWGYERHGLDPELVVLGKPMANGLPVSAVVGGAETLDRFGGEVRYFSTFGGTPVGVAAASAVLEVLSAGGVRERVLRAGAALREGLAGLAEQYPGIAPPRGAGLFLGLELVRDGDRPDPERASALVEGMRERGVLLASTGPGGNVLKIRPPLVFDEADAERLTAALEDALASGPEPS
ncbi:MAG: aminotransferase class III-fold pyridoxal phosphate-dependent enzyme [Pseudoclavibacter sp.]|nr:aminotransferase class III-fold pyridoxal phosphate-dependent enzyme [Pseudoclavibacter sp.]